MGDHDLLCFAPGAVDPTGILASEEECSAIAASLALTGFHDLERGFDCAAFEQAVRTLVRALDAAHGAHGASPRRPIVVRLVGLAPLIMRCGLAYDSEDARQLAAGVAALAHAAAVAESALLADGKGAYPSWSRDKRREELVVKAARDATAAIDTDIGAHAHRIYRALPGARNAGLRASVSVAFALDAHGARLLDCATAGLGPLLGVSQFGARADCGFGRVLSEHARAGLVTLG